MSTEIIEKDLSYKIIEAAYEVHNQLGPGFLESIYEGALRLELLSRGHLVEDQKRVSVYYKGQLIGEHTLDLIVDGKVILELKALSEIARVHKQQALSYLKATGLQLAIVVNFGGIRLQYARVVYTKIRK